MKRHINLTKFTCFVLLIAMIASVLVAGTYAKYTSTASGTNATVVATWSFQVNGEEIAVVGAPKTIAFGLFDTINDSDGVNAETDVSTGLIAPGTSGSFEFTLQNTSDVTAQYGIDFTVTNEHDIPIEFSLDGVNWSYELKDVDLSSNTILPIGSAAKAVTVLWRWAFDGDADKDTDLGTLPTAPTITVEATVTAQQLSYIEADRLQSENTFTYYSDFMAAVADINGGAVGTNGSDSPAGASIGVYTDESGVPTIVLLKDVTVTEVIYPETDMTINLAGYTLTSKVPDKQPSLDIKEEFTEVDLVIEGTAPGSKFLAVRNGVIAKTIQPRTGTLTINGATIEAYSVNGSAVPILGAANMTINDATIIATCIRDGIPDTTDIHSVGIQLNGPSVSVANNTKFLTYSDYIKSGSGYTGYGSGLRIMTGATMVLNDCYAMGSHSGISNQGTVYINGGVYESYGHGGVYFGGLNNTPTTSYVKDAIIRQCPMTEGFTAVHGGNDTGFYVGGSNTANYITVYIDNSEISGNVDSFAIRDTRSEHDNKVYISNSTINTTAGARSDGPDNQLYIGSGNNFDINNISCRDAYTADQVAQETGEDYSQIIDDAFDAINATLAE